MRTIVVKRREKISGPHLAGGIKKRTREAREAAVAADPYTGAIGEGVINSIVDFAATCMVPAITIIALNSSLVNLNRFVAYRTWMFYFWTRVERNVTAKKQEVEEECTRSVVIIQNGGPLRRSSSKPVTSAKKMLPLRWKEHSSNHVKLISGGQNRLALKTNARRAREHGARIFVTAIFDHRNGNGEVRGRVHRGSKLRVEI